MKKLTILLVMLFGIILLGCKKEEIEPVVPIQILPSYCEYCDSVMNNAWNDCAHGTNACWDCYNAGNCDWQSTIFGINRFRQIYNDSVDKYIICDPTLEYMTYM